MTRWQRFWRARLSRRIFGWFGATMLVMMLATSVVGWVAYATGKTHWQQEVARFEAFAGARVASVWDDPAARDQFMADAVQHLDLHIRLEDPQGNVLDARGPACDFEIHHIAITRGQQRLGTMVVCPPHRKSPLWALVVLAFVFGVLWVASAMVAREIGRPLQALAAVARRIGEGDLEARAEGVEEQGAEISTLAHALHDMAARIDRQLRDQRTLLAGVSHELRTPLGHLRLLVEIMRDVGAGPERLDEIEREVVEMDELVDQLLASSRLTFDLKSSQRLEVVALAIEALERAGLDPTLLDAQSAGWVEGDPTLLQRALANLLRNARDHGAGVTGLVIEARPEGLALMIEDRGPGMDEGDQQRLFDPFVQSGPLTSEGNLGLGLFLVQKIAAAHGGRALAEENPGGGARVGLALPVA